MTFHVVRVVEREIPITAHSIILAIKGKKDYLTK
jgi:hypothetical protein